MAKIILGKRPEFFKKAVKFPMLDDTIGIIECQYKYRTRKEFSEFVDARVKLELDAATAAAAAIAPADDDGTGPPMVLSTVRLNEGRAAYILDILKGWNVEAELNLENVIQLVDELPAAAVAIIETYRLAVHEGRLGN